MKLKINFQKSHPQTSETAIGAVVGTDLEQMWVIYLFCWNPLKIQGFSAYRTDGTDAILLLIKIKK